MLGSTNVLLVDDPTWTDPLARGLEEADERLEIVVERSPVAALSRLDEVDCVISAYDLPEMTGIEFLNAVREDHPDLPFVVLTEECSEELASAAISAGASDYFIKDREESTVSLLATRIAALVEDHRQSQILDASRSNWKTNGERIVDVHFMFSADWNHLLYINSAYEDVWGASVEKLRASPQSFLEHVHPEDRATAEESMRRLSNGESTDVEYRVRAPGGETRWVRGVSEPIFDAEGEVIRVMGSVRDITRLKEREERFRSVFEESFDAMVIADDEGNYVSVNPAACELFGLEEEDLVGRNVAEFAAPEYDVETAWEAFQSRDAMTGRFPLQRQDGTVRIVEYSATTDIVPGEHLSVLRDITDEVRQQHQLEESRARYQTLVEDVLDTSSVGTIILDDQFDVVWINAAMERYFGIDRGTVLGKNQERLVQTRLKQKFAQPEQFARRILRTYAENTSPETFECKVQGDEPGTWRWLRHSSRPIRSGLYEGGRIEHYSDITDIRTRDRQLKVLARVLRHNLHNKLNVVLGFADQIKASSSGRQHDRAQRIIRAATDLLEVSDRQKQIVELISDDFELETLDLAALVREQVALVQEAYPAAEITTQLPERAPVRAVEAVGQAIGELLENAAMHCEGAPRIDVTIDERPDAVTVSVHDRNEAIPDLEKSVLRGDVEIDQLAHSRGLGLWLVNWLVVRSDGTVAFERTGDGNRVRITLRKASP